MLHVQEDPFPQRMSVEEYLQLDERSPQRLEYHQGIVYALAGASLDHNTIIFNLTQALKTQLKGSPCRTYFEGVKTLVAEDIYYYPDVVVTCDVSDYRKDPRQPRKKPRTIRSPHLVIEVLSPETERTDRGEKMKAYQACSSIDEIVLVNQFYKEIEVWRRADGWQRHSYESGEVLELASLDLFIDVDEIYDEAL
ncbi:MAG: Uma2 family endonuclease [Ktedonobacteraceae bacterium]|nr:Uma2 family endonuclease [Ktedonobacteraceae bacterium]MBO0795859.1 Uma2 family endonuclease [Ktedonobacteraceae bacterium]